MHREKRLHAQAWCLFVLILTRPFCLAPLLAIAGEYGEVYFGLAAAHSSSSRQLLLLCSKSALLLACPFFKDDENA